MVEEEVDVKILLADVKMILPTNKSKPLPQFKQKFFQMDNKLCLHLPFMESRFKGEKIKYDVPMAGKVLRPPEKAPWLAALLAVILFVPQAVAQIPARNIPGRTLAFA